MIDMIHRYSFLEKYIKQDKSFPNSEIDLTRHLDYYLDYKY